MKIGTIMITDGGPHPSDKWAKVTADQIGDLILIDENSDSPEAKAARLAKPRFILDITDSLDAHHDAVQQHERGQCEEHGVERLSHALQPEAEHIDCALEDVVNAAKGTPFEAHFASDEVKKIVRHMIGSHFTTSIDIDRSHHADNHRGDETAHAYCCARENHGAQLVNSHIHHYRKGGSADEHAKHDDK